MKNNSSLRDFLKMSSIVLAASFLAACNLPMPSTNTPTTSVPSTNSTPPPVTGASTNSNLPIVLNSPLDDAPEVFMNTYYGAIGASMPTSQNPLGIHQGMDFVAPTGTPVKATASGVISRIDPETKTEYDGTVNTYANVILDIGGQNSIIYIFEPFQNLFVTEGQMVDNGDILGTLGDNRGQNMRGTLGTGTLDFGLMSLVDGSYSRICFVPYASSSFKTLMETWFNRAFTATAEHPGPCVCHYHSAAVTSTNSNPPPVLNSPLDDTPEVFMNTYYGEVGSSIPTTQNPQGIHQGMDFVAPTGTPVKATAAGTISRITTETKTEPDGTVNTYAGVLLDIGGDKIIGYGFEPLQSLFVTEGQVVNTGDIIGTLGDNRGQNRRSTKGTGTLDFGLMSLVNGSFIRICFVPYASSSFKTLMETWFSREFTATAEHPGPCTCHYHYP